MIKFKHKHAHSLEFKVPLRSGSMMSKTAELRERTACFKFFSYHLQAMLTLVKLLNDSESQVL